MRSNDLSAKCDISKVVASWAVADVPGVQIRGRPYLQNDSSQRAEEKKLVKVASKHINFNFVS